METNGITVTISLHEFERLRENQSEIDKQKALRLVKEANTLVAELEYITNTSLPISYRGIEFISDKHKKIMNGLIETIGGNRNNE